VFGIWILHLAYAAKLSYW